MDDWGRANPDNLGDFDRLDGPSSEQLRERADLQRKALKEAFVCVDPEAAWIADHDPGDETDVSENPRYGPGNPDWEHDRHREDAA